MYCLAPETYSEGLISKSFIQIQTVWISWFFRFNFQLSDPHNTVLYYIYCTPIYKYMYSVFSPSCIIKNVNSDPVYWIKNDHGSNTSYALRCFEFWSSIVMTDDRLNILIALVNQTKLVQLSTRSLPKCFAVHILKYEILQTT